MWFTIGLMLGSICGLIVCSCAMVSQITSLENVIAAQKMEIMDLRRRNDQHEGISTKRI